jgi:16S rRNA (uracil1498-N3)-methyltransferase
VGRGEILAAAADEVYSRTPGALHGLVGRRRAGQDAAAMQAPPELRRARVFTLARTPAEGPPRLAAEDERHAVRVLRMRPGDTLLGFDGRGTAWPLRVVAAGRGGLDLEPCGEPITQPRPGADGAALPWIEVAVALPRGGRSEEMVARLVQLGAAALSPLVSERVQGPLREISPARLEHLRRAMRESCKQCRRLWLPELREPLPPSQLRGLHPEGDLLVLDPDSPKGILAWARERCADGATARRPLVVVVGPEGGLTEAERADLRGAGAHEVRLGPYLLRIETAAEAAVAGLVLALAG